MSIVEDCVLAIKVFIPTHYCTKTLSASNAYKYCLRIRKWHEPIRPRYGDRKYKMKEADLMLITKDGIESELEEIRNIANFLRSNSTPILRYFYHRESNARAEALNQNLQSFVSINYGAGNTDFFLYRITLHFS